IKGALEFSVNSSDRSGNLLCKSKRNQGGVNIRRSWFVFRNGIISFRKERKACFGPSRGCRGRGPRKPLQFPDNEVEPYYRNLAANLSFDLIFEISVFSELPPAVLSPRPSRIDRRLS